VPVFPEYTRSTVEAVDPTVVFLGRLERRKGALDLMRAIPLVLDRVPNAKFIFIGPDRPHCPGGRTHREYLESQFTESVRRQIVLKGPLDDAAVTTYLQTADLFVAPSLYESFGLIFLEAMRWGTPVVGTTAGAIPEIIEDGKSGILVRPGNHLELADAIGSLLANPQQRRSLGEAGRERVESRFSVQAMTTNTIDFYRDVIARAHHRRH
jgi:glycogen synthase